MKGQHSILEAGDEVLRPIVQTVRIPLFRYGASWITEGIQYIRYGSLKILAVDSTQQYRKLKLP